MRRTIFQFATTFLSRFRRAVIVWIPAYDSNTHPLVRWLDSLRISLGTKRRIEVGTSVDLNVVARNLRETDGLQRVMIFLGHGTPNALLGPPTNTDADIIFEGNMYSVIYDESMVDDNPNALFAFCCYAGIGLGNTYRNYNNCSFLGFTAEVFLPVGDKVCRDSWRNLVSRVSEEIIKDGSILPKHEQLLRDLYHEYINYFMLGGGKAKTEDAFLMAMYMNWQDESLCRYP